MVLLGGIADSHPLIGNNGTFTAVILDPKRIGANTPTVQLAGNAQGFGQPSRTGGIHAGANQHRLRVLGVPGHHIQQPMHPVAQININGSGIGIEYLGALGAALVGMAGGVFLTAVDFGFGNPQKRVFRLSCLDGCDVSGI